MNGRERLHKILNRQPVNRLSWTTLVDPRTLSMMPEPERSMGSLDFYRRIGCDVLQYGDYALPTKQAASAVAKMVCPDVVTEETTDSNGVSTVRQRTPWGDLTTISRNYHPIKYSVETMEDLRILKKIWLHTRYEENPEVVARFPAVEAAVGDRGLFVPVIAGSPVQQLIQQDMGLATFYYFLEDARAEVEDLLAIMHEKRKQEYEIIGRCSRAEAVIPGENTSSTLTSPAIYEKYSLPQLRDYGDILHRHGKKMVLHMCGRLRDLLPIIRRTACDGYNATTPPTPGNTPLEYMLDAVGEDVVLFGGIFTPDVFQGPSAKPRDIWKALDALYTPRLRKAHLVLWLVADGLPTPLERFLAVGEWMEKRNPWMKSKAKVALIVVNHARSPRRAHIASREVLASQAFVSPNSFQGSGGKNATVAKSAKDCRTGAKQGATERRKSTRSIPRSRR